MRQRNAFRAFGPRPHASLSAVLIGALLLCVHVAQAHQSSLSYADVRVRGARLETELRLAASDALVGDGSAPFAFSADGAPCALDSPSATRTRDGDDGLLLRASYLCPALPTRLDGRATFLDEMPPGHTLLLKLAFVETGTTAERVLQPGAASFTALRADSASFAFTRFLRLGVTHIFTGTDHLAFLLGLLLLGGSLGALVRIVTAFTIAHSITLALAALDILSPPARIIEPAIAVSILCVAMENLWALRRQHAPDAAARALRHRWIATFFFGLIHGFGFADALRELQLPRESLAASLLSFNLGVELGQLCIVAATLPLLALLARWPAFARRGPQIISMAVGAAGTFWLVQRLSG